ncbi:MAG: TetR/AcrR family transcriptional regulator [Lachnospiraceae bacterium]
MARKPQHTSEETKESIRTAFLELYQELPLEKITIAMLTKKADVNRGTFYYYYEDIYALLAEIEEDYLTNIKKAVSSLLSGVIEHDMLSHLNQILQFYQSYKELLLLFLVKRPNARIIEATKSFAQSFALQLLKVDPEHPSKQLPFIVEYIANAQIGMVSYWLQHEDELSISDFAQLIMQLNLNGPITILEQNQMHFESENI